MSVPAEDSCAFDVYATKCQLTYNSLLLSSEMELKAQWENSGLEVFASQPALPPLTVVMLFLLYFVVTCC